MNDNRRKTPRYPTDQFVPAVLAGAGGSPLGGHVVDISLGGARVVAAPNLTAPPQAGARVVLTFARSDGNRDLDVDGVKVNGRVIDVREPTGARVVRLQFVGEVPPRLGAWIRALAQAGPAVHDDALPEFDPEVWAGWTAISPAAPSDPVAAGPDGKPPLLG